MDPNANNNPEHETQPPIEGTTGQPEGVPAPDAAPAAETPASAASEGEAPMPVGSVVQPGSPAEPPAPAEPIAPTEPASSAAPAEPAVPEVAAPAPAALPAAPEQPEVPAAPVVGGGIVTGGEAPVAGGAAAPAAGGKPGWRKPALIAGVAVVVLAGLAAGFYFGYYQNPTVVWKQSLADSNKAYDKLVDYLVQQDKANYKGAIGSGSYKFKSGTTSTDGKLNFQSDGANSDTTVDLGLGVTRVTVELRTIKQTASDNPDVYLKADGITGLGDFAGSPQFSKTVNNLNGKWIVVDHTLLDNLQQNISQTKAAANPLTESDVVDEVKAFGNVNKQYVFTTDKDKAVTKVVKTYGKETVDGHQTIHYQVAFVKANVKSYITAQRDALKKSKLGVWLQQQTGDSHYLDSTYDDLQKSADNIKDTDTVDVWADLHNRIIYKVRVPAKQNPATNFAEFGLDYKGGDVLPFFLSGQSKDGSTSGNGKIVATVDTKANSMKLDVNLHESGTSPTDLSGTFTFKPSNSVVKVETPQGAEQLSQVLDSLGLGDLFNAYTQPGTFSNGTNPADTALSL